MPTDPVPTPPLRLTPIMIHTIAEVVPSDMNLATCSPTEQHAWAAVCAQRYNDMRRENNIFVGRIYRPHQ